eukprot:8899688-Pyramimonas_sp.AAC.1
MNSGAKCSFAIILNALRAHGREGHILALAMLPQVNLEILSVRGRLDDMSCLAEFVCFGAGWKTRIIHLMKK